MKRRVVSGVEFSSHMMKITMIGFLYSHRSVNKDQAFFEASIQIWIRFDEGDSTSVVELSNIGCVEIGTQLSSKRRSIIINYAIQ